jgi:hypothetical protein
MTNIHRRRIELSDLARAVAFPCVRGRRIQAHPERFRVNRCRYPDLWQLLCELELRTLNLAQSRPRHERTDCTPFRCNNIEAGTF